MQDSELEELSYSTDYDINVRIIAFAVVTIVLIVVMIFFLKTYATQKQQVLKTLDSELIQYLITIPNINNTITINKQYFDVYNIIKRNKLFYIMIKHRNC